MPLYKCVCQKPRSYNCHEQCQRGRQLNDNQRRRQCSARLNDMQCQNGAIDNEKRGGDDGGDEANAEMSPIHVLSGDD